MALKQNYVFKGVSVIDAYHKIREASIYKADGIFKLSLSIDIKKDADSEVLASFMVSTDYDISTTENILVSGYKYIKTLPDFLDAVDC